MDTKQLWIQKIECICSNTQGTDECYLDVYLDTIQQLSLRMILSAGQSWTINESFSFQSQVEVKLSYQNSGYNNDLSEIVRLQTQSSSEILTVCFHLGSGFYQLFYKISLDQQRFRRDLRSGIGGVNPVPTPPPTPTSRP
jgi:hypothetical protein